MDKIHKDIEQTYSDLLILTESNLEVFNGIKNLKSQYDHLIDLALHEFNDLLDKFRDLNNHASIVEDNLQRKMMEFKGSLGRKDD